MTVKEYKEAFIKLYNQMNDEHGDVVSVMIRTEKIRAEIPIGASPQRTVCTIMLGDD